MDFQVLESRKLADYQYNCCIRHQKTPCALELPLLKRQSDFYIAGFTLESKIMRN